MKPLKVQPVLVTALPSRREALSWRGWGALQTPEAIAAESARLTSELSDLAQRATFSLEFEPLAEIQSPDQVLYELAPALEAADVVLIFGTVDGSATYEALASFAKDVLVFVRHESGPFYGFYETVSPRFLRKESDEPRQPGFSWQDVVVDDYDELLWRLQALYGLHNTKGTRVVCLGSYAGWQGRFREAWFARKVWGMDIKLVSYAELQARLEKALSAPGALEKAHAEAEAYVKQHQAPVKTDWEFLDRAFIVYHVFEDLLEAHAAENFTIGQCMGTLIQVARTTACLPLSLLNDSGRIASCEAVFDTVPTMTLLHYISGRPGFLNDPTFPHAGKLTLGHCTAPTKLDGHNSEPLELVTHYESDYGVAPKVLFSEGAEGTLVFPDFSAKRWYGITARVLKPTSFDACRSQVDVALEGDWQRLAAEMRGFHCVLTYGDWHRHLGYVLPRVGIEYVRL